MMGTIGDERGTREECGRPRIFKGRGKRTGRRVKARRSTSRQTVSPLNAIPRCQAVKERRKLPPGPPPTSPSLLTLPSSTAPSAGAGMLTGFPFGARGDSLRGFEAHKASDASRSVTRPWPAP